MLGRRACCTLPFRLAVLVAVASLSSVTHADAPPFVVIVSEKSPLRDVSVIELRRLFMSRTSEIDGRRVMPLNHPPKSPPRVRFDERVLEMTPAEVGRYWIDRRIRGESGPPRTVSSTRLLVRVVERLENTIGYVRADEVDDGVRVVTIDGKGPRDEGYVLR